MQHRHLARIMYAATLLLPVRVGLGQEAQSLAQRILAETGIKGGLIVHLGCGDGKLTAALRATDSYVVHGLDADAANVAKARAYIRSLGLYGSVAVDRLTGSRLPYASDTVNLLVSEGLGGIAMGEVVRVLAPNGVGYVKQGGVWQKSVKPQREGVDEWTHYLHDASGNPVADDSVIGPPRRLQWSAGPSFARSHEHTPSVAAVVSSGGRIFYLVDEAPTTPLLATPDWQLVARDAYNGVLLWKRSVAEWWPHLCGWTQGPRQAQRKLVAIGDRVYVTLGLYAPLTALDAATGELIRTYDDTDGAEEVLYHNGTLLAVVRSVTEQRQTELKKWTRLSQQEQSPLYDRDTSTPLLKQLRAAESKAPMSLLALAADSGRLRWQKGNQDVGGMKPLSLCAVGDSVFYYKGGEVKCLDFSTGEQRWSERSPTLRIACDRGLVCADKKTVTLLSRETGQPLWKQDLLLSSVRDAFAIGDSLWLGGFKPFQKKRKGVLGDNPAWGPYFATERDFATGKVLKHIEPENPGHHHRCYENKATNRYLLGGRRGTEFIDLKSGEVLWNSWARGVCRYGVMPANGLLYAPPHACGCYATAMLEGFNALAARVASESESASEGASDGARLERGPAFTAVQSPVTTDQSQDWPTYRRDAERSGSAAGAFSDASDLSDLSKKWQTEIGGKLTAPTVANSKVLVASPEDHRVRALDAETGKAAWEFTAGARVDSPPTVHGGNAIFGSHDGHVYSVRLSDGALAWRLRAARGERRVVVDGQVESVWPVHGSVLIRDDIAYATAGRSSYLDDGIDLCRFSPATGEVLSTTPIYSPDPETDKQPAQYGPNAMPGARTDLLSSDADHVYLRQMVFGTDGKPQQKGNPHLLTVTGFLDDTWTHRSYWIYGTHTSLATGCSGREKNLLYGRLLSFNESTLFGYGRKNVHWSNQLQDGAYRVFAVNRSDGGAQWEKSVPLEVRAMVLTDKALLIAGPPAKTRVEIATGVEKRGAVLLALSTADGSELGRCQLDAAPVLDGLAVARGRLYLTTTDGNVVCLDRG